MSPRLDIDDERREMEDEPQPQGTRPLRAALLALVVAGLVGGSWWAGHSSKSTTDDVAVPEIHPDAAPVKEPPKDPGGMVVPDQDSALLNRNAKEKPEELLPAPEVVKQRPAPPPPPPQVATNPPPPATLSPPATNASPPAVVPAPVPEVATPSAPVSPPTSVAPKVAAPAPAPPKAAPASPPAPGSYRLQLGALKTEELARTEWLKLQRQNSDVLGKLSLSVSRVELGGKGTYYRIQAGPIADESRAVQACAALKSRSVSCILVKP
jgi:cell division septation protein DedD